MPWKYVQKTQQTHTRGEQFISNKTHMELTKALEVLEAEKKSLTDELGAVTLAIESLKSQFAPQLAVLDNARREVEAAQEAIEQKDAVIAEKDIALQTIASEKAALEVELASKEEVVVAEEQVIA